MAHHAGAVRRVQDVIDTVQHTNNPVHRLRQLQFAHILADEIRWILHLHGLLRRLGQHLLREVYAIDPVTLGC